MRSWHRSHTSHLLVNSEFRKLRNLKSGLADDWLAVVTRHVVEPHTVVVKVVEDGQADLIPLSVIRLRTVSSSSVGPVDIVIRSSRGPANAPSSHLPPCPEVLLPLPGHQTQELPLLGRAVQANGPHTVVTTESFTTTLCERGTSKPPANQVSLALELMVWLVSTSTPSSSSSTWSVVVILSSSATVSSTSEQLSQETKLRRS